MQKRGNLLKKQITSLKAESEGFKPPVRTSRTADFESAPIDHSGNFPWHSFQDFRLRSPWLKQAWPSSRSPESSLLKCGAKVDITFVTAKLFPSFFEKIFALPVVFLHFLFGYRKDTTL